MNNTSINLPNRKVTLYHYDDEPNRKIWDHHNVNEAHKFIIQTFAY